jgi:hypothetical protein
METSCTVQYSYGCPCSAMKGCVDVEVWALRGVSAGTSKRVQAGRLFDKVLLHRFMVGQFLRGDSLPGSGLLCRAGNAEAAT